MMATTMTSKAIVAAELVVLAVALLGLWREARRT